MNQKMDNSLNSMVGKATFWSSMTETIAKIISPIVNMILARLLTPEAFGIVATLTMVTSFADIFTDAGFQKYIVQHEFSSIRELDNTTNVAFWTNLGISTLIFIVIFVARNKIAMMVGNPGYGNSISIASIVILLTSFSSIQQARYKRAFDFKTTFFIRTIGSFIPLFVTVPLALIFKNYWALLIGNLASNLFRAVALTIKSPWKPQFFYDIHTLKEMFSFSIWTLIESISIWLTSYIGTFIVGNYLSVFYLGLYKTTITTISSIVSIITSSLSPVLFAALSRCQANDNLFEETYFTFQRLTAVLVIPLGVGIFVYNKLITRILLGNQWLKVSGFLGLYGLNYSLLVIFNNYNSEVFRSKGKPKISLMVQLMYLMFLCPTLLYFVKKDFSVFTIFYGFAILEICVNSFLCLYLFFKIKFTTVLKNIMPSIVSAVIMGVFGKLMIEISISIVWQCISVFLCIGIYFMVLFIVFPNIRKEILNTVIVENMFRKVGLSNIYSNWFR